MVRFRLGLSLAREAENTAHRKGAQKHTTNPKEEESGGTTVVRCRLGLGLASLTSVLSIQRKSTADSTNAQSKGKAKPPSLVGGPPCDLKKSCRKEGRPCCGSLVYNLQCV